MGKINNWADDEFPGDIPIAPKKEPLKIPVISKCDPLFLFAFNDNIIIIEDDGEV